MGTVPKNRGKKSLLMCFKPIIRINDSFSMPKQNASDPVLTYLTIANKDGVVLPNIATKIEDEEGCRSCRSKKGRYKRLAIKAAKAALKKTPLVKKIISRRKTNSLPLSKSTGNLEDASKISLSKRNRTKSMASINYTYSSTFTSSPYASSSSSIQLHDHVSSLSSHELLHSPPTPSIGTGVTNEKQSGGVERKRCFGSTTTFCMFSISLLILVVWGKFPAILWTSIWFYLVPPSRGTHCNAGSFSEESELLEASL
ncbi:hypothetical protein RJT34_29109 [Clitoria ternatea]|uniref:Uncharacterized protein n=1 Tax=Clitoria ternatea TaxID=43366 RepID=A0AAN9FA74_CLITE